jgi:mannose-6-phosphate isomerase-like protein (cupin superfamily)
VKVESEGLFVGPDEGKALPNPIGGRMVVKLRDGDTDGSFSVHDNVIPAGSPGPLPHLHRNHEETFYVLEGELTVRVGERTITAPVGSFVVIPRGVVHQPSNPGTEPTRVLLIFSPSGMEHFFEEAAEGRIPSSAGRSRGARKTRRLCQEIRLRVRGPSLIPPEGLFCKTDRCPGRATRTVSRLDSGQQTRSCAMTKVLAFRHAAEGPG